MSNAQHHRFLLLTRDYRGRLDRPCSRAGKRLPIQPINTDAATVLDSKARSSSARRPRKTVTPRRTHKDRKFKSP